MKLFDNFKKLLSKRVDIPMPFLKGKFGDWLKREVNLMPKYFRDSYRELQKVTWPSRKETWKLFLAVVVFAAALASLILVADLLFEKIIERLILQ